MKEIPRNMKNDYRDDFERDDGEEEGTMKHLI